MPVNDTPAVDDADHEDETGADQADTTVPDPGTIKRGKIRDYV